MPEPIKVMTITKLGTSTSHVGHYYEVEDLKGNTMAGWVESIAFWPGTGERRDAILNFDDGREFKLWIGTTVRIYDRVEMGRK